LCSKKQKIVVRISFLYSRVELDILLSHLKNSSFLKNLSIASILKIKIAKNKITRKAKIVNLFKNNKIATTKEIVNIYKYKNYKYINKSKEKYYLNNNKHYELN